MEVSMGFYLWSRMEVVHAYHPPAFWGIEMTERVFTDSDVTRLREWLHGAGGPTDWTANDSMRLLALIHRLECAERVAGYADMAPLDDLDAWRKSAGRE